MRGIINIHYYYIPINKVEAWNDNVLWLKITENEVKEKYERDKIPDPRQYFIKDYPYYTGFTGYNYPLPVISRRYSEETQIALKKQYLRKMFIWYTNVTYATRVLILKMN